MGKNPQARFPAQKKLKEDRLGYGITVYSTVVFQFSREQHPLLEPLIFLGPVFLLLIDFMLATNEKGKFTLLAMLHFYYV